MQPHLKALKNYILLPLALLLLSNIALQAQVEYEKSLHGIQYDVGFKLIWSTSSETNNQLFVIERSIDGSKFKPIGSVDSKANDAITEYQFKDLDLGLKNARYRLKQVSVDGGYSYSEEVTLKKEFACNFKVVKKEKITSELFQISVNTIKEGELECRLTNDMGDVLLDERKPMTIGLNDFIFDLQSELDGKYSLIFKLGPELESVLIQKETKEKKGNVANKKPDSSGGG